MAAKKSKQSDTGSKKPRTKIAWRWVAIAVLSGVLLTTAFAPFNWMVTAWFALTPVLWIAGKGNGRQALLLGWIAGMAHNLTAIWWVSKVSWIGMILLCAYCAVYWMPAVWAFSRYLHRADCRSWGRNLVAVFSASALWVASDFLRGWLFTGFPWNSLAVSQSTNYSFIQAADLFGTHGLTFVIAAMNFALVVTAYRYQQSRFAGRRLVHLELMAVVVLMVMCISYGVRELRKATPETRTFRAGLLQTNLAQDVKWDQETQLDVYYTLTGLSREAAEAEVDLVIWPETAVPFYLESRGAQQFIAPSLTNNVPVLVGVMRSENNEKNDLVDAFNSSVLYDANGQMQDTYDKRHLVPFGEVLPLGNLLLPIFQKFTIFESNFMGGRFATVFDVDNVRFASLICFEDILPYLARDSVNAGARLLINQTNDAWFDISAGPEQHVAHAAFRSVEHHVPSLRCCNTGVSCAIDRYGRVIKRLLGPEGHARVRGNLIVDVEVPVEGYESTFYARWGDWFAWCCVPFALLFCFVAWRMEVRGLRGGADRSAEGV